MGVCVKTEFHQLMTTYLAGVIIKIINTGFFIGRDEVNDVCDNYVYNLVKFSKEQECLTSRSGASGVDFLGIGTPS